LPFAIVALLGQASVDWPPGPIHLGPFWLSSALLLMTGIAVLVLRDPPPIAWLVSALTYIASVAFLMLATGGVTSGLGSLLMIPIVAVGLYGRERDSAVALAAVIATMLAVSFATPHIDSATVRRSLIFGATGAMLSVAVHALRARLVDSNQRTSRLLAQAQAMNSAAEQFASLHDPPAIMAFAVELAPQIASVPAGTYRRATYYRIDGDRAEIGAQSSAVGDAGPGELFLDDNPYLRQAVWTARPLVNCGSVEPGGHEGNKKGGTVYETWVPVCPDGSLHGVLSVQSQGFPLPADCVDRCTTLGHLLESALSNWNRQQRLEQQATLEERRRIARELHDGLAHELAYIASKAKRAAGPAPRPSDIREVAGAADRALDEARRAITLLTGNGPQTLNQAVAQTAEDLGTRLGLSVRVDVAEDVDMPADVTEHLLRIVREAMTNAANHAQAHQVTVRLQDHGGVRLVVEDDGCGFDPNRRGPRSGFGLLSMEERATSVGARFQLESAPSRGTRIEVAFA
jgi:signal transduction histidine kinase